LVNESNDIQINLIYLSDILNNLGEITITEIKKINYQKAKKLQEK